MRKLCRAAAASLLYAGVLTGRGSKEDTKTEKRAPMVSVAQIVKYKPLNTIRNSSRAEMEVPGYRDGENIELDLKDTGGQQDTLNSIMLTFTRNKSDIIVAIAAPVAMAAAKYSKDIPIVFPAVNDPVGAGLMDDLKKLNNNIIGTSDEIQVDQILGPALRVDPNLRTLGLIYSSSEANSVSNLVKAKEFYKEHDTKLMEGSGANITETQSAVSVPVGKCDVIFAPSDNMVAGPMSALVGTASKKKVPIYTGTNSMVSNGGFATVGIDRIELGKEVTKTTDKVLKGEDVESLPVKVFKDDLNVYANEKTAETLGIQFPKNVENSRNLVMM